MLVAPPSVLGAEYALIGGITHSKDTHGNRKRVLDLHSNAVNRSS